MVLMLMMRVWTFMAMMTILIMIHDDTDHDTDDDTDDDADYDTTDEAGDDTDDGWRGNLYPIKAKRSCALSGHE